MGVFLLFLPSSVCSGQQTGLSRVDEEERREERGDEVEGERGQDSQVSGERLTGVKLTGERKRSLTEVDSSRAVLW